MKLLANENFPLASKKLLLEVGHDIIHIGQTNGGISDETVMKIAIAEERTILTFDRDYGELIFKYGYQPPKGVIYFRWTTYHPEQPAQFFIELLEKNEIIVEGMFTVVDDDSIRQRKY